MDLVSLLVWALIIYMLWVFIDAISSLREEVKEMRMRCIKEVHNNDISALDSNPTKDPKKTVIDQFSNLTTYIKKIV